jgi:hypothetical protein
MITFQEGAHSANALVVIKILHFTFYTLHSLCNYNSALSTLHSVYNNLLRQNEKTINNSFSAACIGYCTK